MSEQNKTPLQQIQLSPKKIQKLKDAALNPLDVYNDTIAKSAMVNDAKQRMLETEDLRGFTPQATIDLAFKYYMRYAQILDSYAQNPNDPSHSDEILLISSARFCLKFEEQIILDKYSEQVASLSKEERVKAAFELLKRGITLGYDKCLYMYCIYSLINGTYAEDVDKYIKMLIKTDCCWDVEPLLKVRQLYTPKADYF